MSMTYFNQRVEIKESVIVKIKVLKHDNKHHTVFHMHILLRMDNFNLVHTDCNKI